ncbi:unnamed protein product [Ambrosiozyma monospora]|uniref:Unnamed protein product n=1 Tax=Ambrosiozyma monospora TaxID=43982 RepID=A0A9W7DME5_AMBMO|nr:unnamed protein product [Ambrosiozyma monospora]
MENLSYFGVITDGMLDHETMNTIPKSVRDLEIHSDYSPMVFKFNLPPFLQTLRTGPELLGHFHLSHDAVLHLDTLKLDINRLDEIYEDYPTWKFLPRTINLIYVKYYNRLMIPPNDGFTTSLLTQRMAGLRGQLPIPLPIHIPKIGSSSSHASSGYTENKMFGMSIPETIPTVEIVLQFMEEDPRCDAVYINVDPKELSQNVSYFNFWPSFNGKFDKNQYWCCFNIGYETLLQLTFCDIVCRKGSGSGHNNHDDGNGTGTGTGGYAGCGGYDNVVVVCDDAVVDHVCCYLNENAEWLVKHKGAGSLWYFTVADGFGVGDVNGWSCVIA